MPGRRSISVEPENIAVASPRRSSRIKVSHQDSPLPAAKTTEQELPVKRTRRSSSIQEKSLSDIKDDLKKTQDNKKDDDKPKTPARRTRRSISAQEEQKPVFKDITIRTRRSEIKKIVEDNEDEEQPQQQEEQKQEVKQDEPKQEVKQDEPKKELIQDEVKQDEPKKELIQDEEKQEEPQPEEREDQKSPTQDLEILGGRPKRRVTRSMSKSPVSLKNAKAPAAPAAPVTRSRRVSLNDKQANDLKVPTLDIITEIETEHEKIEETTETDVLNNNKKKQTEISEKETASTSEEKMEIAVKTAEKTDKNETEIVDVPSDTVKEKPKVENLNESVKEILNISVKSSPRRSPRVNKINESMTKKDEKDKIKISKDKPEISEDKSEISEDKSETSEDKSEISEKKAETIAEPETKLNEEKIEMIEKKLNELIELDEESEDTPENISKEVKPKETETKVDEKHDTLDSDKLNVSNISIIGNTSINMKNSSLVKEKEDISQKVLEDDERPQNISLVNDDGRSYSPIVPKTNVSLRLNDSQKSINSTSTPHKLNISSRDTSQTMETLQISIKDDEDEEKIIDETINTKDMSVNLDASINSIKSTPAKSINDSTTSVKSLKSGKKSNISTPIRTTENKENDDMNISTSSKKKSSSKRASMNQLRDQILDDYIATFTAEKKRKRNSMDTSESDSSEISKKRRSSQTAKVSSCNFSDDEEDEESDDAVKNEFIDDTVSVGSEDTPSIDSNEIIDEGESVGSSDSDHDSNETYENDSFVVDDDVEDELLSGTEDFLGSMSMPKQRKRILKVDSDSEEEENDKFANMSMEPFGGNSPSDLSEKQISSIDSDLESVKNKNEELSKQIEEGTFVPEVEPRRKIEESESDDDDDIMIVELKSKDDDKNESMKEEEIVESIQKETIEEAEHVEKETIEETEHVEKETIEESEKNLKETIEEVDDIQKETIEEADDVVEAESKEAEDSLKETIEEVEDIQKETIEEDEDIQKETIEGDEDIQKETTQEASEESEENDSTADVSKSSNLLEEKSDISENETKELNITSEPLESENIEDDNVEKAEHENKEEDEENKETKYKKLVEKYFNVTKKNRSRRQTIGEEISKTPTKPSRKRRTSLGIELSDTTKEDMKIKHKKDHEKKETQIIEVKIDSRQSENETAKTYEFNTSGVYEVSPCKIDSQNEQENKESLSMLQDFNDSLNDSLDLLTSASQNKQTNIVEQEEKYISPNIKTSTKKKQNQNRTPVQSSEESENASNTGSSKKKRKNNQLDDEVPVTENIVEETISKRKKRRQRKSKANKKTETATESDTMLEESKSSIDEINESENETSSEKKKRKMSTEETNESHKKKKLNRKQSASSESDKTLNSSGQSSTNSEKQSNNKNRKKNKSPQNLFNFKIQNGKLSPSKSEIDYEQYVPPRHRNIYKNLIKPSSSGFSGSSQFVIKDLVSKVSHGIKKQKYTNVKLNKNSITGMTNCGNWKETLLADEIVKTVNISKASNFRKHKK